jgi:antitoxin MazE
MRAKLVRIGNSRGVRLPKSLIEHCGFEDEVELDASNGHLLIRGVRKARAGWDSAFRRMRQRGDDQLLDSEPAPSPWDRKEWRW